MMKRPRSTRPNTRGRTRGCSRETRSDGELVREQGIIRVQESDKSPRAMRRAVLRAAAGPPFGRRRTNSWIYLAPLRDEGGVIGRTVINDYDLGIAVRLLLNTAHRVTKKRRRVIGWDDGDSCSTAMSASPCERHRAFSSQSEGEFRAQCRRQHAE